MSTDVKFINTTSSKLNNLSISNGQLIVLSDKSGMYYDMGGVRYPATTYNAGTGLSLSGNTFSNSGVRSIATGTAAGTISVNTNGTSTDVAVKGVLTTENWSSYLTTIAVFG